MKKRERISAIMTENVLTCDLKQNMGLKEVRDILEKEDIRHMPVVYGNDLRGIISMTDIQRISYGGNFGQGDVDEAIFDMLTVERVMSHNVETIDIETTIKEAAEKLARGEYNALPVTQDEKLVGIVTTTDLIEYLVALY